MAGVACLVVAHLVAFVAEEGQVSSESASCQAASAAPWVAVVVASFLIVVVQDSSFQSGPFLAVVVVAAVAVAFASAVATDAVVATVVVAAAVVYFQLVAVEYFQPVAVVVEYLLNADVAFVDSFLAEAGC